jgi:NMD protein affecting ribosome stability and mRNA decay
MRTPQRSTKPGSRPKRQARGNPRLKEEIHDPYRARAKLKGPARCTQCGATYFRGRWRWQGLTPAAPASIVCPACQRCNDRYPAGEIAVSGSFLLEHGEEVESLIRNTAEAESKEHPLHRIMKLRRRKGAIDVTTTDIHLPHRIGHALEDAWGGELTTHYDPEGYYARVTWQRND